MKLQDQTSLRIEDMDSCECPTCNKHLEFIKDGCRYITNHCDKIIVIEPKAFVASVTKNPNVKVPKNI